jgi:segregation and condensation protein A
MNFNLAFHASAYEVATPVFEGPLDLLLHLIESAQLDITKLALAQVTDQFLEHLRDLEEHRAEEVSSFLVIAAKLVQIKSEVLLPRPPVREEGEEDPGEALARQLIAYKRFKQIANFLSEREKGGFHTYIRLAAPARVEGRLELEGLNSHDLADVASTVFVLARQLDPRPSLDNVVGAPKITIRQKIELIAEKLRQRGRATFNVLLGDRPSRLDIVVTFLAMLELIKLRLVLVHQEQLFGQIELEPAETWDESEEFELEFGE